jgi:Aspartyl protease
MINKIFLLSVLCSLLTSTSFCQSSDGKINLGVNRGLRFELLDNRIFIGVSIKNKLYHFVLDCGAVNVINIDAARELGLPITNLRQQSGAGSQTAQIGNTVIDTVCFGSITMTNQNFTTVSLNEIRDSLKLKYMDGLIGYEFFRQFVVEVNYPGRKIRIFKPGEMKPGKKFTPIPFTLYRNQIPKIQASVDDVTGDFIFDTGDRSTLTVFSDFADSIGLKKKYLLSDTVITGYGIGGAVYAQTFKLKQFSFAGFTFKDTNARIPTAVTGGFARRDISGSIGNGLLKNYTVIFNYPDKKIFISK